MISINLHPRDLSQKTPQRIWAVFYVEKQRVKIDLNQFILPNNWSKDKQKALTSLTNHEKFNKHLKEQSDALAELAEILILKLTKLKKRFYKDTFQSELQEEFNQHFKIGYVKPKQEGDVVDFISFIDKYLKDHSDLEEGTLQTYRGTKKNILLAFGLVREKLVRNWKKMSIRQRKLNPDFLRPYKVVDFDEIDEDWLLRFKRWLLKATYTVKKEGKEVEVPYSKNYIAKEIAVAKRFCIAAEGKYIKNSSFRKVSASWEEADTIALSWEEISKLKALELSQETKEGRVRNLFIFNCYCGLRFSDLNLLDGSRFTKIQGQLFIKLRMKKTDDIITYPVANGAVEMMNIYNGLLPKVSEFTFNETIKGLCLQAGIINLEAKRETRGGVKVVLTIPRWKMVSSHTGRRTFATNFEEAGVPIAELMAITGHTTEKAFRKYVKKRVETKFAGFLAVSANL